MKYHVPFLASTIKAVAAISILLFVSCSKEPVSGGDEPEPQGPPLDTLSVTLKEFGAAKTNPRQYYFINGVVTSVVNPLSGKLTVDDGTAEVYVDGVWTVKPTFKDGKWSGENHYDGLGVQPGQKLYLVATRGGSASTPAAEGAYYKSHRKLEVKARFTGKFRDIYHGNTSKKIPEETIDVEYELYGEDYNPDTDYNVSFVSSMPSVISVSGRTLTAKAPGHAVISLLIDGVVAAEREYISIIDTELLKPYPYPGPSAEMDFAIGYRPCNNAALQSFDMVGNTMYLTSEGSTSHALFVSRLDLTREAYQSETFMTLKYFGHGDNMFVEHRDDADYMWVNCYGSDKGSGQYINSQTVARVRLTGGTVYPWDVTEHYYIPDLVRVSPAYDADNNELCIWGLTGAGVAYYYVYDMDEAKNSPVEDITLAPLNYGGDDGDHPKVTGATPTVKVHNLGKLTPIYKVRMPFDNVSQGIDWHHGKFYYLRSAGYTMIESGINYARIFLVDTNGKGLYYTPSGYKKSGTSGLYPDWIMDTSLPLNNIYLEAEGFKIKGNTLYMGFANMDPGYLQTMIFKYNF